MYSLSIFLGLCLIFLANGHGECPNGNWNKLQNICWRESNVEYNLWQGIEFCKEEGHKAQVIPVGELRNLRNKFDRHGDTDLKVEFQNKNHPFFVNAIKSHDGEWRDIHHEQIISFHHFPHFHVQNGKPGDSLIWDPEKNELLVADTNAEHRVLCHWQKDETEREQCPGFIQDNLCNQAGDCKHGICHCDQGFSGTMCQIMERHDAELVIMGLWQWSPAYPTGLNGLLYNFQTNTTCKISSIPEYLFYPGMAEYFNDQAHFCTFLSPHCYIYNPELKLWLESASMSKQRVYGSAVLVPNRHSRPRNPHVPGINNDWPHNYYLWATGGISDGTWVAPDASTEINQHGEWKNPEIKPDETNILLSEGLFTHCMVQINSHETAFFGGITNLDVVNKDILVYNWKNHTWRTVGQVPVPDYTLYSCGLIKNPSTGRDNVLVTGGIRVNGNFDLNPTWLWDPVTGNIQNVSSLSSTDFVYGSKMIRFSEFEVLIITPSNGLLHSFTIADGWKTITSLPRFWTITAAPMLVPKGLFECQSV